MKQPHAPEIIKLWESESGYTYNELAEKFVVTRSIIAGIIWRYKNPGMWKKGIKSGKKRKHYK